MSDDENPDSLNCEIDNFYEDTDLESEHPEDPQKIIETLTELYISEETNEYRKFQNKDKANAVSSYAQDSPVKDKEYEEGLQDIDIVDFVLSLKESGDADHDSINADSNVSDHLSDLNKSNTYCVNEIKSDLRKFIETAESKFDQTDFCDKNDLAVEEILHNTRKNIPSQTTKEIIEDNTKSQELSKSEYNDYCVEDIKSDLRKLIDGDEQTMEVNDNNFSERYKKGYNQSENVLNEIDHLLSTPSQKSKQATSNSELLKKKIQKNNITGSVHEDKINEEPDILVLSSRDKYGSLKKAQRVDSLNGNSIHDKAEWRLRYF